MLVPVPEYYTYKVDVPLLPGQTLAFTPGLGYYAKGTPTPNQATKNTTGLREPAAIGTATAYPAPSPATAARTDRQTSGYNEAPLSAVVAAAQTQLAPQKPTPAERLPPSPAPSEFLPPTPADQPPSPSGPLSGLPDGSVYTLGDDGLWHHIPNVDTFNALGLDWNAISWDSELPGTTGDELPTRQPIAAASATPPPNGATHEIQPSTTGTPIPRIGDEETGYQHGQFLGSDFLVSRPPLVTPPTPHASETKLLVALDPQLRFIPFPYHVGVAFSLGSGGLISYDTAWDTSALVFPDTEFQVAMSVTFKNARGQTQSFSLGTIEGGESWPGHPVSLGQGYLQWKTASPIVAYTVKFAAVTSHDLGSWPAGAGEIKGTFR
jgi:hypothetical protein